MKLNKIQLVNKKKFQFCYQLLCIIKGISHLASARIVGDKPYYTRASLAHDFDPTSYRNDKVRNDVNYLSYYSKNRDAVAADETGKRS